MSFAEQMPRLLPVARPVAFAKGARLVRQGESSRGAFLIRKGEVEAQVALPGGGMLTVAEMRDGDMLGEMALIERGVCSATVVARSDVEGWFIERDDFRAMVASRDAAALQMQRAITRVLAAKLRALNAKLREHPAAEDRPARETPSRVEIDFSCKPNFEWRAFLPLLRFFEGFDDYEIDELTAGSRVVELPRERWLFAIGARAHACFLVVRGALEVFSTRNGIERRVAVAGPGELVGYLAVLEGVPHGASAKVRESACLLEFPAERFLAVYQSDSGSSVRLQQAVHRSLLRSLARTNTQLTRLISHARLEVGREAAGREAAGREVAELETALHGQLVQVSPAA